MVGTDIIGGNRHNWWGQIYLVGTGMIGWDRLTQKTSNPSGGWVVGGGLQVHNHATLWPNLQVGTCKNSSQVEFQVRPECGNIQVKYYQGHL